jgi:hypothetical protein
MQRLVWLPTLAGQVDVASGVAAFVVAPVPDMGD